jgi:hypothetical protein
MTKAQSQIVAEIIDLANEVSSSINLVESFNGLIHITTRDIGFDYHTTVYPNGEYETCQKKFYGSWSEPEPYLMPLGGAIVYA